MPPGSERAAIIYQHEARGTDLAITSAIDAHVESERSKGGDDGGASGSVVHAGCAGLTAGQLKRRAVPPSSLSLLDLVRHVADEERGWFRQCAAREDVPDLYWTEADNDAALNDTQAADAEADLDTYRHEIAVARNAVAGKDLDDVVPFPWGGPDRDLPVDLPAHDRGVRTPQGPRRPDPRVHRRRDRRVDPPGAGHRASPIA